MSKRPNSWLLFSSLAFQIAIVMYFAVFFGQQLDEQQNNEKPYFTLTFSLFGLVAILVLIIKQTKRLR